ncbi:archease (plasmid) [Haloferacaceae archaeon DSL9]
MSYTILDRPVDVKFRATGRTLEDAFGTVVPAIAAIVGGDGGGRSDGPEVRREVRVGSESKEALLFDFLDRLIVMQDVEGCVISRAEWLTITEDDDAYALAAMIVANPISITESGLDIKAPTYSEMRVESNDEWVLEAVLDV